MLRNRRGHAPQEIVHTARGNRKSMTPAEEKLWETIRNRQAAGLKFRKQHPIGRFILDFYCIEERLAIEVDGEIHQSLGHPEYDEDRTALLSTYGIRVLRFTNDAVLNHTEEVIAQIMEFLNNQSIRPATKGV